MQAATYDTPIFIDRKAEVQHATTAEVTVTWTSITGTRPIFAEFRDEQPSRDEAVRQRLALNTRRARVQFPFQAGVNSTMRVRVNRGEGDEVPVAMGGGTFAPPAATYQIVGGPAIVGARKEAIEIFVERYSS